jgi:hypothetical protein
VILRNQNIEMTDANHHVPPLSPSPPAAFRGPAKDRT